jgi:hypothetical protein
LRHHRIQADRETIRKSLEGHWRREHLFTLRQSREAYGQYRRQIEQCDTEINELLGEIARKTGKRCRPGKSQLGDYLRRMKARLWPQGATMATARKTASLFLLVPKTSVAIAPAG